MDSLANLLLASKKDLLRSKDEVSNKRFIQTDLITNNKFNILAIKNK